MPHANSTHPLQNRRRAFTMTELLVVLAIIGVLLALLLPAVEKVRQAADLAKCASNLHQIGVAIHNYNDSQGQLPYYRLCPDPWQDGLDHNDLYCNTLTSPTYWTGPNEVWWAPYDNRVPPTSPPLPDFDPSKALIWQYVEGTRDIFNCPEGQDVTLGSPTAGQYYQISYGMNYVTGGPNGLPLTTVVNGNGSSNVMIVWDHAKTPGCANSKTAAPRGPWKPYTDAAAQTHYPLRHNLLFNVLFTDGHVMPMRQNDLQDSLFYAR